MEKRNEKTSRGECWKDLGEVVEWARIDRFMRFWSRGEGRGIGALRERSLVARAVWRRDAFERFD